MIGTELMGMTFTRLKTIEMFRSSDIRKRIIYKCICDCGNIVNVYADNLLKGASRSCGCLRKDICAEMQTIHGFTKTRPYRIWSHMKGRCYCKTDQFYKDYGGRGIIVCDEWKKSFVNFINDMGQPPSNKHSIDRIDNNGNYELTNCRWATIYQQASNKRNNVIILVDGLSFPTLASFQRSFNITDSEIRYLLYKKKLTIEQVYKQFKNN